MNCSAMSEHDPFFVPTKSSKFNNSNSHKVVVHESTSKKPTAKVSQIGKRKSSLDSQELSMKQVRFEVYKFSHSTLSSTDKQKSKIELAIKLGAKPPRNKFTNYKRLKENKIKEQEEALKKKELYNTPIQTRISEYKSKLNKGALRRKRKIGSGILNVYGKVSKNMAKNNEK